MKKIIARALGVCLAIVIMVGLFAVPQINEAAALVVPSVTELDPTTIYHYETSLATNVDTTETNSIRLAYDPITQKLLVAVFENGDAAGYVSDDVANPIGTFTLHRRKIYNDGTGSLYQPVSTIVVEVNSINTDAVEFSVVYSSSNEGKYTAPKIEETPPALRYGVCSNPNGTGACDQVHTRLDWYRCFVCCFYGGGCGA